jgi:predicted transcriptional regulator
MRIFWVILSVVFISISIYAAIYYFHRAARSGYDLDSERYTRMLTEESLLKANRKIDMLESEVLKLQKSLSTKEQLIQQVEAVNADLKVRLEKIAKIKENMEKKLRELMAVTSDQPLTIPAGKM